MKTTFTLTEENAGALAAYARILGCTPAEFLNRYARASMCPSLAGQDRLFKVRVATCYPDGVTERIEDGEFLVDAV